MSVKETAETIIETILEDTRDDLREIGGMAGLNADQKKDLCETIGTLQDALSQAQVSLADDPRSGDWLMFLSIALIGAGAISTSLGQATRKSRLMSAYARLRVSLDPKQKEKALVKECWTAWQEKTATYKSKAEFARDMLTKCENLRSQKKIEDWCRQWESNRNSAS
ncbi:hypothetical protein [Propionivibrio soli]|jgi:hypothetical protein|uniref:hypothetical protein n=1 Tax=Propionivibrio soli TaxID=2976531 RepID=UPI0021E8306B|nr:hypothetical protein [Propionivibrio soli]